jgi:hypothetical protein
MSINVIRDTANDLSKREHDRTFVCLGEGIYVFVTFYSVMSLMKSHLGTEQRCLGGDRGMV